MILRNAGITDVSIHHISGDLTDNYNPKEHTLNLSDSVYGSRSIAAIGVAAHECGHAIQHANAYGTAHHQVSHHSSGKYRLSHIMAAHTYRTSHSEG